MSIAVEIAPNLEGLDESHSAYELATQELVGELEEVTDLELGTSRVAGAPDRKGWQEILTAVLTDGLVIPLLVEVVKSWVTRDQGRTITVVIKTDDDAEATKVTVIDEASAEELRRALDKAAKEDSSDTD